MQHSLKLVSPRTAIVYGVLLVVDGLSSLPLQAHARADPHGEATVHLQLDSAFPEADSHELLSVEGGSATAKVLSSVSRSSDNTAGASYSSSSGNCRAICRVGTDDKAGNLKVQMETGSATVFHTYPLTSCVLNEFSCSLNVVLMD
jgi:hypothetical protein